MCNALRSENLINEPENKQRTWVHYERDFSNSLWYAGWKLLYDDRWLVCYQDDASRFVTGYGMFEDATTENTLAVLEVAIKEHGKPAAILTDRKKQFYASESEVKKNGVSKFEQRLVELDIHHILTRSGSNQTNGKLKRLFGEVQRKLPCFEQIMQRVSDPVDLFMKWYNYDRPHMSLGDDGYEKPYDAFLRKQPPEETDTDEHSGEKYPVR